jgi:hypothetical protein
MSDKEVIEERVKKIEEAVQQSAANHSTLLGHLAEAKFLLESILKLETEGKAANEATISPVFEGEVVEGADLGKSQS